MNKIITLDPAHRQSDDYVNYTYDYDFICNPRVLVLDGTVETSEYILAHSKDVGIFKRSDHLGGECYYFVMMRDTESAFMARLTGQVLDKAQALANISYTWY